MLLLPYFELHFPLLSHIFSVRISMRLAYAL